jgi:hypothetical protein
MAIYVYKNCKLYVDGYNLSGDMNQMNLGLSVPTFDTTTFSTTTDVFRSRIAGIKEADMKHHGFWQANSASPQVDDVLDASMGASKVVTICPVTGAAGEHAWSFNSVGVDYRVLGPVGEPADFDVSGQSTGEVIYGTVLANQTNAAAGANGTAYNVGTALSTQRIYAALHVTSVTGVTPSLGVTIQSDTAENFPSPQTRLTFDAKTAVGAQWITPVAGPGAGEVWWRAVWTVSADDTFSFIVTFGII